MKLMTIEFRCKSECFFLFRFPILTSKASWQGPRRSERQLWPHQSSTNSNKNRTRKRAKCDHRRRNFPLRINVYKYVTWTDVNIYRNSNHWTREKCKSNLRAPQILNGSISPKLISRKINQFSHHTGNSLSHFCPPLYESFDFTPIHLNGSGQKPRQKR